MFIATLSYIILAHGVSVCLMGGRETNLHHHSEDFFSLCSLAAVVVLTWFMGNQNIIDVILTLCLLQQWSRGRNIQSSRNLILKG